MAARSSSCRSAVKTSLARRTAQPTLIASIDPRLGAVRGRRRPRLELPPRRSAGIAGCGGGRPRPGPGGGRPRRRSAVATGTEVDPQLLDPRDARRPCLIRESQPRRRRPRLRSHHVEAVAVDTLVQPDELRALSTWRLMPAAIASARGRVRRRSRPVRRTCLHVATARCAPATQSTSRCGRTPPRRSCGRFSALSAAVREATLRDSEWLCSPLEAVATCRAVSDAAFPGSRNAALLTARGRQERGGGVRRPRTRASRQPRRRRMPGERATSGAQQPRRVRRQSRQRGRSAVPGRPRRRVAGLAEGAGRRRRVRPGGGKDDHAGEVVDPDHEDQRDAEGLERAAWLVNASRKVDSCLSISNATAPSNAPGPQRPAGHVRIREEVEEGEEEQRVRRQAEHDGEDREEPAARPVRARAGRGSGSSTLVATPETATLTTSTEPRASRARMSRSLPITKLGCSRGGLLEDRRRSALRMPESQPRPE